MRAIHRRVRQVGVVMRVLRRRVGVRVVGALGR